MYFLGGGAKPLNLRICLVTNRYPSTAHQIILKEQLLLQNYTKNNIKINYTIVGRYTQIDRYKHTILYR